MNSARVEKSYRLQRVISFLSDKKPHSTRDIMTGAYVCAVNSCISELRANGYDIDCRRKNKVWIYRLRK